MPEYSRAGATVSSGGGRDFNLRLTASGEQFNYTCHKGNSVRVELNFPRKPAESRYYSSSNSTRVHELAKPPGAYGFFGVVYGTSF